MRFGEQWNVKPGQTSSSHFENRRASFWEWLPLIRSAPVRPRQGRAVGCAATPGVPSVNPGLPASTPPGSAAQEIVLSRVAPLSAPDPEGITAHSRSVEDLQDDTTGSLF